MPNFNLLVRFGGEICVGQTLKNGNNRSQNNFFGTVRKCKRAKKMKTPKKHIYSIPNFNGEWVEKTH